MKVASWNVNSVNVRRERLLRWLADKQPDVLCIQELKGLDEAFPSADVYELGYQAVLYGQRTYNGVAILAKFGSRAEPRASTSGSRAEPRASTSGSRAEPRASTSALEDVRRGFDDGEDDLEARFISARVAGLRVLCCYVPNGGELSSPKWLYKQRWLDRLLAYLERHHSPSEPLLVCGDFNIAPEDRDCYDPDGWRDSVLFHELVKEKWRRLLAFGLIDTYRLHVQEAGKFSWWDYRMLAFPKGRGLRIDHLLATRVLAERCTGALIDREERKGKQPSDHAPVMIELDWPV